MGVFYILLLCFVCGVNSKNFDVQYYGVEENLCDPTVLVVYRMTLKTFWTEERFPKSYPKFRPPAQWSTVFGQSHNSEYNIFNLGAPASPGLRKFVERGDPRALAEQDKRSEIFDQFTAAAIKVGQGETEEEFFVDANHSMVSVVCRIVPSPDWFIGVSSVDLCYAGEWLDNLTISMGPLDGGTDGGLTFTSPRWRLAAPAGVTSHAPRRPDHRAASFYYPDLKELPQMAEIHFTKLKEYDYEDVVEDQTEDNILLRSNGNETVDIEMVTVNTTLENSTYIDTETDRSIVLNIEKAVISNSTDAILKSIKFNYGLNKSQFSAKMFRPKITYATPKESQKTSPVNSNLMKSFINIMKKSNSTSPQRSSYFSW